MRSGPALPIRSPKMMAPSRGMVWRQMRRARRGEPPGPIVIARSASPKRSALASVFRDHGRRRLAPPELENDRTANGMSSYANPVCIVASRVGFVAKVIIQVLDPTGYLGGEGMFNSTPNRASRILATDRACQAACLDFLHMCIGDGEPSRQVNECPVEIIANPTA